MMSSAYRSNSCAQIFASSTRRTHNAGRGLPKAAEITPPLRRSCRARHDTALLHLHRCLQPALDIEQHPWTIRMVTDRPEHQLPVDAVEEDRKSTRLNSSHVEISYAV